MASWMSVSIADRLRDTGGRSSGFDYLRLVLAVLVVAWHSVRTSHGIAADLEWSNGELRPFIRLILPMFFALSGFLVAGSLERSRTPGMFLGLRAIRIYPALSVEVLLSAFILGPLLTSLPLSAYFSDGLFWSYLWNAIGHIHYTLPGVFEHNPEALTINRQLWTVPYELYCYLIVLVLALLGIVRHRVIAPASTALLIVAYLAARVFRHGELPFVEGPMPGPLLVASFLAGISVYLYRDTLPWSAAAFVACTGVSLALLGAAPIGDYLAPLPIAYLTAWLGLCNPRRVGFLKGADYSYGIFLYGFVIQQTLVSLWPGVLPWTLNVLIAVPLATLMAAASWHFIEKPALGLRRPLARLEDRYLARRRRLAAAPV